MFKSVPVDERADKAVYDTRGVWPDQPRRPTSGQAVPEQARIAI